MGLRVEAGNVFQSHAGSIEAGAPAVARTTTSALSIPRWFD